MKRLHILVEGPTEEMFVNELLYPVLLERGCPPLPTRWAATSDGLD